MTRNKINSGKWIRFQSFLLIWIWIRSVNSTMFGLRYIDSTQTYYDAAYLDVDVESE